MTFSECAAKRVLYFSLIHPHQTVAVNNASNQKHETKNKQTSFRQMLLFLFRIA